MPYVITRLCDGCKAVACVSVCPVDCIYGLKSETDRGQLYIHPDECIDCGACEPECPYEAIFPESDVPAILKDDVALNADVFKRHPPEDFTITPEPLKPNPSSEEVSLNKGKHGL